MGADDVVGAAAATSPAAGAAATGMASTLRQRFLRVEVHAAKGLAAKDSAGASNPYCTIEFAGASERTTTKAKDLNPIWDESFTFPIPAPKSTSSRSGSSTEYLELSLYSGEASSASFSPASSFNSAGSSSSSSSSSKGSFLGRVRIPVSLTGELADIPPSGHEQLQWFLLERKTVLQKVKGELGLKLSTVTADKDDEDSLLVAESAPLSRAESTSSTASGASLIREGSTGETLTTASSSSSSSGVSSFLKKSANKLGVGRSSGPLSQPSAAPAPAAGKLFDSHDYIFLHVVQARSLLAKDAGGTSDPFVTFSMGGVNMKTRTVAKNINPQWRQVFAIPYDPNDAATNDKGAVIEMTVWDENKLRRDNFLGVALVPLNPLQRREPGDPAVDPVWYPLAKRPNTKYEVKGEIEVAVWLGSKRDEHFLEAYQSEVGGVAHFRARHYMSPVLWYLRCTPLQAENVATETKRSPEVVVRMKIGNQKQQSSIAKQKGRTHTWPAAAAAAAALTAAAAAGAGAAAPGAPAPSQQQQQQQQQAQQQHVFVVAEPLDGTLEIELWDIQGVDELLWTAKVPLSSIPPRLTRDPAEVRMIWLERPKTRSASMPSGTSMSTLTRDASLAPAQSMPSLAGPGGSGSMNKAACLSIRLALEGGMHVVDEFPNHLSSAIPSAEQLVPPPLGQLEVGILGATALERPAGGGRTGLDTYAVAKYGRLWVRTRTVTDDVNPFWREQCAWNVYEPSSVLTVAVFEQRSRGTMRSGVKDVPMGRVRLRISSLENNRVYTNRHPLLMLTKSGVKKVGELELALRFSCTSTASVVKQYICPPLPYMHYAEPLPKDKEESLRQTAMTIVAERLTACDPPLSLEVVNFLADSDENTFSIRRLKANIQRVKAVALWIVDVAKMLAAIRSWENIPLTIAAHLGYAFALFFPAFVLPLFFFVTFLRGLYFYTVRPHAPPFMDAKLSNGGQISDPNAVEEGEEELEDTTAKDGGVGANPVKYYKLMKARYEMLKSVALEIQKAVDIAAGLGERVGALLSWRDPRASAIITMGSLLLAVILYIVPFRPLALCVGWWLLRHPSLRPITPTKIPCFFNRLPSRGDIIY